MASQYGGLQRFVVSLKQWRGTLPFVFLTLTLFMAAALAYQANDAARSHRNTVENTLRDYAGIAAWEYTRRSRSLLQSWLNAVSRVVEQTASNRPQSLPPPELLSVALRRIGWSAHTFFRIDMATGRMWTARSESALEAQNWINDSVLAFHRLNPHSDRQLMTADRIEGLHGEFVVHWALQDRYDRPVAVYGFVTSAPALSKLFTSCSREELLPATLAGGQHTDSLLFLSVMAPDSVPVFESPVRYDTRYSAIDSLGDQLGGFLVRAAIRPDAAANLIIGGLPRSRVPLLLGLLVLSLGGGLAALHQLRRERQLARLRDDFVSGVSHELRTPLAQIRMFGELLDGGRLRTAEERERSANVINREARRLTHLVENILHFSRLRRRTPPVRVRDTDLSIVVEETIESFGPLFHARRVFPDVHLDPGIVVAADPNALSQVLINLLDNALKYGPEGQTIRISLTVEDDEAVIAVEDEGPGVPPKARTQIWEAYRRLDRDANTTVAGSGIGLAVVSQLTALHGGRAYVEDGRVGARFVVRLPGVRVHVCEERGALRVRARA
jgi:signal transduction histidine kinase